MTDDECAPVYEVVLGKLSLGTITAPDDEAGWMFGYMEQTGVSLFEERNTFDACKEFALSLIPKEVHAFVTFEEGP